MSQIVFSLFLAIAVIIAVLDPAASQCTLYTIRSGDTFFGLAQQNGITVNDMINANPGVDFNRLQIGQIVCIPTRAVITTPLPGPAVITTQPPFNNLPIITTQQPFFINTQRPPIITTPLLPVITTPLRLPIITTQQPPFFTQTTARPNLRCDYVYVLKSGDQCSSVARMFPAFNNLNPGLNCAFLQLGQRVCIGNNNGFIYNQCKLTTTVRASDSCQSIGMRTGSTMEYLYNCNPAIDLACDNLVAGQTLNY